MKTILKISIPILLISTYFIGDFIAKKSWPLLYAEKTISDSTLWSILALFIELFIIIFIVGGIKIIDLIFEK